jgi:hypothetical protein
MAPFVPDAFQIPDPLVEARFVLKPLGPEHNERDHAAWMSSIEHIHATPGFELGNPDPWPVPMSLEENLADLIEHAREFAAHEAFAYTVLDPADGDVIGCVYLDPSPEPGADVSVRSWVRLSRAELDRPLRAAVRAWLERDWPFEVIDYPDAG